MMLSPPSSFYPAPWQAPAMGTNTWGNSNYGIPMPRGPVNLGRVQAKDPEILSALDILGQTRNLPQDEAYLQSLGVNILFHNGQEALETLRRLNARVEFGDTGDATAHAIWLNEENRMIINQRYRGDRSLPVLYAIAESIYHEAGHATRLNDNQSSIQEELDCLALNTMAYRAHVTGDPQYLRTACNGPMAYLFENGVALYPRLFFDPDPYKQRLVGRIIEKYGMLPPDSPDHRIPHLPNAIGVTERVLHEIHRRNTQQAFSSY